MKILVGISGGFDSAYSVHRLLADGHTVEGAVLDMHGYTELAEAEVLAEKIGIKLHVISCRNRFEEMVIDHPDPGYVPLPVRLWRRRRRGRRTPCP